MAIDENWDVILIGAGQNNFALGTYLGMAGLETVIFGGRFPFVLSPSTKLRTGVAER